MALFLTNKCILLGVTGGIAAYKSAELVRRLREVGATVRVVMTENAKRFITPLTMQAVSGYPVHDELFDLQAEAAMGHIELARWADCVVVAPATADFIANLNHGIANDLLTTLCLATKAPIALAPAMNQGMWKNTLTQENVQALKQKHIHILGPTEGSQACGDVGPGRMIEPTEIVEKVSGIFKSNVLAGLRVLITAGPTHEAIDPVRFITNGSSGKMGYALAQAAREAGANVTLISGPVSLPKPMNIAFEPVVSALEMYDAVMRKIADFDIFVSVAAVGDYRCEHIATEKIHKKEESTQLQLLLNPDIVSAVGKLEERPFVIGFAAETENVIEQARKKRLDKHMDMIVANRVGEEIGMGSEENEVTVIWSDNEVHLPATTKRKLARQLIALIAEIYKKQR